MLVHPATSPTWTSPDLPQHVGGHAHATGWRDVTPFWVSYALVALGVLGKRGAQLLRAPAKDKLAATPTTAPRLSGANRLRT